MRTGIPVKECLEEAYLNGPTVGANESKIMQNAPELPMILDRVYPLHEIVKIEYYHPGCPPRADLIWATLGGSFYRRELKLPFVVVKYD